MKKILVLAAFAVLSMGSLFAQNNFRGVITYSVTSTGEQFYQVPDQIATAELKVYDDKCLTSSMLFTKSPIVNSILVDGHTQYSCMDLTMIITGLAQAGEELSYTGSPKILVPNKLTQENIDSLTIPVTEGFYIEYVNGETKTIAGYTAKKAVIHVFDEDGEDHPMVIWYCDEMGPDVNLLFNGVKGVALEYVIDLGDGQQLTLSAKEIKKGKVKEVDMLLPSGYEKLSEEQLNALFQEINEIMEYMRED